MVCNQAVKDKDASAAAAAAEAAAFNLKERLVQAEAALSSCKNELV